MDMRERPDTPVIGILGLGIMGSAIANLLAKAGLDLVGFDPDPIQQELAKDMGVSMRPGAEAVVRDAEILLLSLPSHHALNDTVDAVVRANTSIRALVDLSTLELEHKLTNLTRLNTIGVPFLDCPISGTGEQAKTGDVSVYASGCEEAYQHCRPLLQLFASSLHYLGEFGNGTKMKLVANLLVAIHNIATAEAMLLGERCGLDPLDICKTIADGAGSSRIFELRSPLMAKQGFEPPTMRLDLWQKDMSLISKLVSESGTVAPLFDTTVPLYEAAITSQLGQQDTAAIYTVLAQLADKARARTE